MVETYRHYYPVLSLGRIHARNEEEAMGIAVERAMDLPDTWSYRAPEIRFQDLIGACLPSCDEHDEYIED